MTNHSDNREVVGSKYEHGSFSAFSMSVQEFPMEGTRDLPVKEKPVYFEDHAFTDK